MYVDDIHKKSKVMKGKSRQAVFSREGEPVVTGSSPRMKPVEVRPGTAAESAASRLKAGAPPLPGKRCGCLKNLHERCGLCT